MGEWRYGRQGGLVAIDVDYPALLKLFPQHIAPKRSESASFLIWYLENYYRLDTQEAVDAVCDNRGDKGVDGIFVNDNDQTITVFQSVISQKHGRTIGDASLREFAGTLTQFKDAASVEALIKAAGNAQLASLAKRIDLVNKISTHTIRGEFVANMELDENGKKFLAITPIITFIGKQDLLSTYISDSRDIPTHAPAKFDIVGYQISEYIVDAATKSITAPIKAKELIAMDGIADQSLFAYNVRGPLGKTQVNKDIVKSIEDGTLHKLFPLFHNGITIIAKDVTTTKDTLTATDYYVVNGCQSLTALHSKKGALTDNLRISTKFIQMDLLSDVAKKVTEYSNNQNGVKARDFMANNAIQIRIQNEFSRDYAGQYFYEIKRGEIPTAGATVIPNETAGLLLMAFDLKEPWATHRKGQVFDERHADLFGKPTVTADRIVLCQVIAEAVDAALPKVNNQLFAQYLLARYFLVYMIRNILENDGLADDILKNPGKFVRTKKDRAHFRQCLDTIVNDLVIDLNGEVDDYGEAFDYRDKLRDSTWAKDLSKKIVADHLKQVARKRIKSFTEEWG
jgi:hypothetical protein